MGIDQMGFPVCPAWLPEDPANGQHGPKQHKSRKKDTRSSLNLTRHGSFSLLKIATSVVTSNTAGTSLELESVKEISYLSSQLRFSSLIPTVRTHIWFFLAKQLLTARTKLKTARNTYPEAHTHRRTLYSTVAKTHQLTAYSRSFSNVEPGFLTGIN
ncbi:hypothetical protein F511_10961 [Dorcoceras hygrometricum]|uniref:Uncharacterized protein n=1 Tax=Dorcoceras hygrometricum TaxID=472368 RepID=A0A2Z7B6R8_9LAMI|nr:hypothetical protein F511_10961 [Dorcoceras hygrometricum]